MGKQVLHIDFDYNFELMAIVSPLPDYRLVWHFNKTLDFNFCRKEDLEIHLPKKQKLIYFSIFNHYCPLDKVHYYFISNKSQQDNLMPELKRIDYFFMIKGLLPDEEKQAFTASIREIKNVQTLFEVNPLELKSRQNLIFDDSNI